MPEIGEVRQFGEGPRVYVSLWVGNPPTLRAGWMRVGSVRSSAADRLSDELKGLPSGTVVDLARLQKGKVVVTSKPLLPIHLDDDTFEALLKEAECQRQLRPNDDG